MTHTVLTFISKVKRDASTSDALRALLKQIQQNPESNGLVPFRKLKSLHFASFVLHEPKDEEEKNLYGSSLVFENNFDGTLDRYLEDLLDQAGPGLHQIYSQCLDYTPSANDRWKMQAYLASHMVRPNAYHIGNTGRSVERILQERDLRGALEKRADALERRKKPAQANELFDTLKHFVNTNPQFKWVQDVGNRQSFLQRFLPWLNLVLQGALAVALIILLLPLVLILVAALLSKERTDSVKTSAADKENIVKLVESEDHTPSVQNHMASITIVKEGWLRRRTLWLVLWAVNLLARARAIHGELSGIASIHFAHWSMIDGGRRLLFLSNFDGSWENYLDDFIDKAHAGLTAIWSNTLDFPRTRYICWDGATDGPRFKAVARDSQTVTNAWYSAYLKLTVEGIDNNSSIREELSNPKLDVQTWLHRL